MREEPIACHKCQNVWTFEPPLGRRDECPKCHSDAKVCLNCQHFDPGAHHECREEQAEWVKQKAEGNFCSYFLPLAANEARRDRRGEARAKLDQLFGGASSAPAPKEGDSLKDELERFLSKKS